MDVVGGSLRRKRSWVRWNGVGLYIQTPVSSAAAPGNGPRLLSELDTWPMLDP